MIHASTFPDLLAAASASDPGQPLVTAYDETTGERTELSVTTYANWVSKTANLLTDELGLDAGDTVLLDLPPHWLVPVFLGAAWSAGLSVTHDPPARHAVAVCGPDSVGDHEDAEHVVACSLRPFAVRFADPLPSGVLDFGSLWPGQSDVFIGLTRPTPGHGRMGLPERPQTHSDLLEAAVATAQQSGVRLLTDAHPASGNGVPVFLAPMVHGGSVVLLRHPSEATWAARRADERATPCCGPEPVSRRL